MRFPRLTTVLGTLTLVAMVCSIDSTDWSSWVTKGFTWNNPNTYLIMTAAFARESTLMYELWQNCYRHSSGEHMTPQACVAAVGQRIFVWLVTVSALGTIQGWWKRDELGQVVLPGGVHALEVFPEPLTRMNKRDSTGTGIVVSFVLANETYAYVSPLISASYSDVSTFLTGHDDIIGNTTEALLVIEVANNTIGITPMAPGTLAKRDGLDSDEYVHGQGSIILECQYGVGHPGDAGDITFDGYEYFLDLFSQYGIEYYEYWAFHGYVGSDSRAKCAVKVYDDDEGASTPAWRAWDDVWASF